MIQGDEAGAILRYISRLDSNWMIVPDDDPFVIYTLTGELRDLAPRDAEQMLIMLMAL